MATKAVAKQAGGVVSVQPAQVYTRINSLLYTLRTIAQCEDQLCTLMHHLRTRGKLSGTLTAELHGILDEMPSREYLHDLEALRASLVSIEQAPTKTPIPAKTARTRPAKRRAA